MWYPWLTVYLVRIILCAAAVSSKIFIVGRAVAGLGAAGVLQGELSIIGQVVELEKRPLCMPQLLCMVNLTCSLWLCQPTVSIQQLGRFWTRPRRLSFLGRDLNGVNIAGSTSSRQEEAEMRNEQQAYMNSLAWNQVYSRLFRGVISWFEAVNRRYLYTKIEYEHY